MSNVLKYEISIRQAVSEDNDFKLYTLSDGEQEIVQFVKKLYFDQASEWFYFKAVKKTILSYMGRGIFTPCDFRVKFANDGSLRQQTSHLVKIEHFPPL